MAKEDSKIRIGITQGDINGVGLEVIVKALQNPDMLTLFTPVVVGSAGLLAETAKRLGIEDFRFETVEHPEEINDGVINVIDTGADDDVQSPGVASREGGRAAVRALEAVSRLMEEGDLDLIVTAPIDKSTAQGDGFHFNGHTEYFEEKFAVEGGRALMVMAAGKLRVALVTTHIPLKEVPSAITRENVAGAIKDFHRSLRMDFGCERPKIAVLSLNPHNGDGGLLGTEEAEAIVPAIEEARDNGILAFGPIAADGFFGSGAYRLYDGVLAMYHDQGLAPFKAIAGGGGVNFTAGLNIVRTSPAHGTAYDKAKRGLADETSMREAIYAAIDIARHRDRYLEASENPLEIHTPQQRQPKKRDKAAPKEDTPNSDTPCTSE